MEGQAQVGVRCGTRSCTYPQLLERAMRAATALQSLGIDAGDRVALLLRNSLEFLEASIATAPLGAGAVPINWHWRGEEIAHVLRDSKAKALVVHADLWPAIADSVPPQTAVLAVPSDGEERAPVSDGPRSWPALLDASQAWAEQPQSAPSSIIYTSGTTGRPKGVVRAQATDAQREAVRALMGQIFQLQEGERTLIPAPMYHTAPNVYALAAAMRGMDMTIMTRFDAEEFLRLVERHRVTVVQMVPTMFVRLLALPESVRNSYDLSSLRWIVHAAAPCPVEVKRAMIEWLGPIVTEYYGSTETGPVVFCDSEQWLAHPGTVGRPLDGALIEVLDADGQQVAAGESGEVFVRLDVWPDFTYEGDAQSRLAMERHGLVSCGDIGYLDGDGYLYLNDRRSDMVISGGVNVYPAEVEACLHSLPGVRDCAVFGIPDEEFGEVLAAHVEAHGDARLTADAVREHVRTNLAAYKTPRVVQFSDSLPREDSGKIFKRRLREPYWAGRERAI
ncbi:MAG TPA: AMP-binding protein [Solirubrobacteraceae bacterium]|jgi:long-chain acyl-CoA synthetase|nr:AMP-binding protein [Solirubrobacteraceae bacterium]